MIFHFSSFSNYTIFLLSFKHFIDTRSGISQFPALSAIIETHPSVTAQLTLTFT